MHNIRVNMEADSQELTKDHRMQKQGEIEAKEQSPTDKQRPNIVVEEESWCDDRQGSQYSSLGDDQKEKQVEEKEMPLQLQSEKTDQPERRGNRKLTNQKNISFVEDKYLIGQHSVDYKFILLLRAMTNYGLINLKEIACLKSGYINLNLNANKIVIKAQTKQFLNEAIQKLSDYIEKLSILNSQFQGAELIAKIQKFGSLKRVMIKDKIVIFGGQKMGLKEKRQIFIGGQVKLTNLRLSLNKLRSYRVYEISLQALRNRRSYSIIISQILKFPQVIDNLLKLNGINVIEVAKFNQFQDLKVLIGTTSKKTITYNEYQDVIMQQIRQFFVLTFCFVSHSRYLQKLSCPNVTFRIIHEKTFNRSYLYVICLQEDFYLYHEQIAQQIDKIGPKIVGVRFFNHISPSLALFQFDNEIYYLTKFPIRGTYSLVVMKKARKERLFNWREYYQMVLSLKINKSKQS